MRVDELQAIDEYTCSCNKQTPISVRGAHQAATSKHRMQTLNPSPSLCVLPPLPPHARDWHLLSRDAADRLQVEWAVSQCVLNTDTWAIIGRLDVSEFCRAAR